MASRRKTISVAVKVAIIGALATVVAAIISKRSLEVRTLTGRPSAATTPSAIVASEQWIPLRKKHLFRNAQLAIVVSPAPEPDKVNVHVVSHESHEWLNVSVPDRIVFRSDERTYFLDLFSVDLQQQAVKLQISEQTR